MVRMIFLSGFLLAGVVSFGRHQAAEKYCLLPVQRDLPSRMEQYLNISVNDLPDSLSGQEDPPAVRISPGTTGSASRETLSVSGTADEELPAAFRKRAPETCRIKISMAGISLAVVSGDCQQTVRSISRLGLVTGSQPDIDPVFKAGMPEL